MSSDAAYENLKSCIHLYGQLSEIIFKPWIYGNLAACAVYGAILVMSTGYIRLVGGHINGGKAISMQQLVLFIYTAVALVLSTLVLAADIRSTVIFLSLRCNETVPLDSTGGGGPTADLQDRFNNAPRGGGTLGNACFMITAWLADALLIWRFSAIYQDFRVVKWIVLSISIALQFAAIALGSYTLQFPTLKKDVGYHPIINFEALTLAQNTILTGLIVGRLLHFRFRLKRVMGGNYGQEYISIASMLVESQAILVVGQAVLLAVGTTLGTGYIPAAVYEITGQLQVLAPISLIYRVMQGRACEGNTMAQLTSPFRAGEECSSIVQISVSTDTTNHHNPV